MDRGAVAKRSRRRGKNNTDNTPQQEKGSVYFSNDTILEAVKFLNYVKWSKMRFLCHRVNQLIQSNQSKLQAFEVKSLSMSEEYSCRSNWIVSFAQVIEPAIAVRKWFQDRGYSYDKTTDLPLHKVFAGMDLCGRPGLHLTIRSFFEESTTLHSIPPKLFYAKFSSEYEFYGPILSHFFRLLHHPLAYFREVSMFTPLTDKFCDKASKNPIRCQKFTLKHLNSSPEQSLKWLKDNVRAQQIILSCKIPILSYKIPISDFHSLILEFILQDASICAQDRIKLDRILSSNEFIDALIKKYETLEVTKAIPTIVIQVSWHGFVNPNLVPQYYPPFYDKCSHNYDIKTYELQNKTDVNRKMIAQYWRHSDSWATLIIRFL